MSHAVMRSTPAPMHGPWIAAMTGLVHRAIEVSRRRLELAAPMLHVGEQEQRPHQRHARGPDPFLVPGEHGEKIDPRVLELALRRQTLTGFLERLERRGMGIAQHATQALQGRSIVRLSDRQITQRFDQVAHGFEGLQGS